MTETRSTWPPSSAPIVYVLLYQGSPRSGASAPRGAGPTASAVAASGSETSLHSLAPPAVVRGLQTGLIQHVATWPMATPLVDRYHPARKDLPKLAGNRRAFGQATIRHAVFGIVLGFLEDALNDRSSKSTL